MATVTWAETARIRLHSPDQTQAWEFPAIDCLGKGCQGNYMGFYTSSNFMPETSIGYLTRRIHQMGTGALEPMFAAEGMTSTQWSALVAIKFERGKTCAALAREMAHDKGAMTRLVDTLEANGWVTRDRDLQDRRIMNLTLTPEGEEVTLRCRQQVIACWNMLLADWDPVEVDTLIALLRKLRGAFEIAGEGPCS